MLNSPLTQLSSPLSNPCFRQLLNDSADIVSHIQIQENFYISHPNYPPLELSAELITRLHKFPINLQHKYLSLQLRNFIYGIYFSGESRSEQGINTAADLQLDCQLENNSGLNLEFYQRLHNSNCGQGFFEPGWCILKEERDRTLAVKKQDLTLHIDREHHLQLAQQSATIGDLVAIRMPRNRVEEGFYVAVGNAGFTGGCDQADQRVEIFFHLSPEGAIALMQGFTQQLNFIDIPFTFKAPSDPADYGRFETGVLCFERNSYKAVKQILQTVYAQNQLHFQPSVPLFTKPLAPGLSLAEAPDGGLVAHFGLHHCQIVADGLLAAWQTGDRSPEGRMNSIRQQFSALGIDWYRPYLNPGSDDIYTPLDL